MKNKLLKVVFYLLLILYTGSCSAEFTITKTQNGFKIIQPGNSYSEYNSQTGSVKTISNTKSFFSSIFNYPKEILKSIGFSNLSNKASVDVNK